MTAHPPDPPGAGASRPAGTGPTPDEPTEVLGTGSPHPPAPGAAPAGPPAAAGSPAGTDGPGPSSGLPPGAGPGSAPGPGVPPSPGGVGGPGGGASVPPERRLRRSTRRKVVAGVAGGLGEYTGVDPVLFRVLFAVLTLFGGTGILLYIVGWLFLPADDRPASPAEALIGRGSAGGSSRAADAGTAVVLALAGLFLAGVLARGDAEDVVVLLVVVGAAYFLLRNLTDRRSGGPPPSAPVPGAPRPYEPPPVAPYETVPAYAPVGTLTAPAPAAPRERSVLGAVTVSVLLLVLGVLAALDAGGAADPAPEHYLAAAVGVLGLGLVVGARYGRARGLVWFGLPMLLLLTIVGSTGVSLRGGIGERRYAPERAVEIRDEYRLGLGSLRLDLSDVDLSGQLKRVEVSSGVGDIEVVVPADADVSVEGRAGAGEVDVLGRREDGTSAQVDLVDYGPGGDGRIDLVLDVDVNLGTVVVSRAQA